MTTLIGLLGTTAVFASNNGNAVSGAAQKLFAKANTSTLVERPDWSSLSDEERAEVEDQMKGNKFDRTELTEEQKTELEARRTEMQIAKEAINEKWSALTDTQKEEIYTLKDKVADAESQIIDKYVEYGLIDEQTAADMKAGITKNSANMRESGEMPMFGNLGGHDGKRMFHCMQPTKAGTSTSTAN